MHVLERFVAARPCGDLDSLIFLMFVVLYIIQTLSNVEYKSPRGLAERGITRKCTHSGLIVIEKMHKLHSIGTLYYP